MNHKKPLMNLAFDASNAYRRVKSSPDQAYLDTVCDPLQIDIKKLLDSKALRRLQEKAQVLPMPNNPHARDRMNHSLEVMGLSVTLANILGLNEYLCTAIALGHDFGHAPLGHAGEESIAKLSGKKFRHDVFSTIVVQKIERKGSGLNLCHQVVEGIFYHSRGSGQMSLTHDLPLEYNVVMYADKISYVFSDLNDLIDRYYVPITDEHRDWINSIFGPTQRTRTNTCIEALIQESVRLGYVSFCESEIARHFVSLKNLMYECMYPTFDRWQNGYSQLNHIYNYIKSDDRFEGCDPAIVLALMTDKEVMELAQMLITPLRPRDEQLQHFGIMEILPYLKNRDIDLEDPDLNW